MGTKTKLSSKVYFLLWFLTACATPKLLLTSNARGPASTSDDWKVLKRQSYFTNETAENPGPWTRSLSFSADGERIALRGLQEGRVYDIHSNKTYQMPGDDDDFPSGGSGLINLVGDSSKILALGDDKFAIWKFSERAFQVIDTTNLAQAYLSKTFGSVPHHPTTSEAVLSRDGTVLLSMQTETLQNNSIIGWKIPEMFPIGAVLQNKGVESFQSAAIDSSGDTVFIGDAKLTKYSLARKQFIGSVVSDSQSRTAQIPDQVLSAVSADGHTCLIAAYGFQADSSKRRIDVYDVQSSKLIMQFDFPDKGMQWSVSKSMSVTADCSLLLVGGFDRAKLMSIQMGKELAEFSEPLSIVPGEADQHQLSAVAISNNGKRIALGYRQVVIFERN